MTSRRSAVATVVAAVAALVSPLACATESASGRPVAGTAVNPGAAVLPGEPLWLFNFGFQAVDGTLGAEKQVPIAGRVVAEAENRYTIETFTLMKVWDTGAGPWRFASGLTVPVMQSRVEVAAYVPPQPGLDLSDRVSGLFDVAVTPVVAAYSPSADEHLALSLRVWAPTGRYEPGQLANLSQNVWTFVPTVAYTRFLQGGWEASGVAALNVSTRNDATDYRSAPLFTLDVLGTRKLGGGWAAGGVLGWIEQIGDDRGPLADRLNGFRGHELALGPIVTFGPKLGGLPLSTSLRWLTTVSQKNRFDRDTLYLSITAPLP